MIKDILNNNIVGNDKGEEVLEAMLDEYEELILSKETIPTKEYDNEVLEYYGIGTSIEITNENDKELYEHYIFMKSNILKLAYNGVLPDVKEINEVLECSFLTAIGINTEQAVRQSHDPINVRERLDDIKAGRNGKEVPRDLLLYLEVLNNYVARKSEIERWDEGKVTNIYRLADPILTKSEDCLVKED